MKTTSQNIVKARVHPLVCEFIFSTTGSDAIEPIPNSNFYNVLVYFMKSKASSKRLKIDNSRLPDFETISCKLPEEAVTMDVNYLATEWFLRQHLYRTVKEIYLSYMSAFMKGGANQQINNVRDFCKVNDIDPNPKTIKTLMRAFMTGEGNQQIKGIRDFCTVYNIDPSPKTIKTLENIWYRSKIRNELNTVS